MRVVSLIPSATEMLFEIGAGEMLVGRSHECDWPREALAAPVLTSARVSAGTSSEIDRVVREELARGESLYTLDEGLLQSLKPDLILTQDLCNVCSIDLGAVERAAAGMDSKPRLLSLNPHTVEDILEDVLRVGEALGLESSASAAMVRLRGRLFSAAEFVNPYAEPIEVAFLEWTDPLFVAGHWTVQMIERAGGMQSLNATRVNSPAAGAAAGPQHAQRRAGPGRQVSAEELVAAAPGAVIICPCGFDMARGREAAAELARQAWWKRLPAVQSGRVAVVDGNQYFNRSGPRIAEAMEWLVAWLQGRGELVPEGFAWEGV